MTVAFEIKSPIKRPSKLFPEGYRNTLVTIWHVDPEKDGTDDSCGWFKRPRHGNKEHYEKIRKEFDYDFDKTSKSDDGSTTYFFGQFHPSGEPLYSPISIGLHFFHRAALIHFGSNHEKAWRFMEKNLYRIIVFAENGTDSMLNTIQNKYNEKRDERVASLAAMVYGCIIRWDQKWWQHARWHVHHWKIQVHLIEDLKRFLFSRCCKCGKGFAWGYTVCTDSWNGTGPLWFRSEKNVYHSDCGRPCAQAECAKEATA